MGGAKQEIESMTIDINKILEGAVAIPYSQDVLDCLTEVCESYLQDDADFEKIEEMTHVFLSGRVSVAFKEAVKKTFEDSEIDFTVADNVLARLSLLSICASINPDDELNAAIRATIFMNYMVMKKGQYDSLPNSTYIKEIYKYHISNYLKKYDSLVVGEGTDWIERIANHELSNLQDDISEAEDIEQIQMLVKEAALYRVGRSVEGIIEQRIENPYLRTYKCFCELMDSIGYLYYDFNIQDIISKLVQPNEEGKGKKKKLSSFITELQRGKQSGKEPCMESSVLLRLIYSQNASDLTSVLDMPFGVREFATYLYYEMLLERIIQKQSE